jgi:hypothetical protein
MAWLFGLLTIIVDYILLCRKFKQMIKEESETGSVTEIV